MLRILRVRLAFACCLCAIAGSGARASDTARSVVAELATRLQKEGVILAESDIQCRYRNETWALHARSVLGRRGAPVANTMKNDPFDGLNVLFPTQTFLKMSDSLDPLGLSLALMQESPLLLPAEKLDGVVCKVLELDRLPSPNRMGQLHQGTIVGDVTLHIYLFEGQIKKVVARLQRPREPDESLTAEVTVRYRRPKTGVKRAPCAPPIARIAPIADGTPVGNIAWTAGGQRLSCLSWSTVGIWCDLYAATTGKEIGHTLVPSVVNAEAQPLYCSADGKSVITLDKAEGCLNSADAATGKQARSVRVAGLNAIRDAILSPDLSKAVLWDNKMQAHVKDCSTGRKLYDLAPYDTQDAQFSTDSKLLALLLGNQLIIKDAVTGRDLHGFRCLAMQRESAFGVYRSWEIAFSPDSRLIALGDARRGCIEGSFPADDLEPTSVYIYEVATGRLVQTLTGMNGAVTALRFSPDGNLLAVGDADDRGEILGENAAVLLWDTKSWKSPGATAVRPQSAISRMEFSPDGKSLATVAEGASTVELWSIPPP